MKIRTRRRKRLLLLLGGVAVLCVAGGGAYLLRQWQLDGRALDALEMGSRAYDAKEWEKALDGYGRYLQRFGPDATGHDWHRYGMARRNVEQPGGKHVIGAIGSLRNALDRQPDLEAARRDLLQLYLMAGFRAEALDCTERILRDRPDDLETLRIRTLMLMDGHEDQAALACAERINALDPADLEGHFMTLTLLARVGRSKSDIRSWADGLVAGHPDDPRFVLIKAAAHAQVGELDAARASLDEALASGSTDPSFTAILMRQLDRADRFQEAFELLERACAAPDADPVLNRTLVRRLWYMRRFEEVVERAARHGFDDPDLLALRVIALVRLDRREEAARVLGEAAVKSGGVDLSAWAPYLQLAVAVEPAPDRVVAACRELLAAHGENAILRVAMGDAYVELGEEDLALDAWSKASVLAPAWACPLQRTARLLMATGRQHLALGPARAAFLRARDDAGVMATWVQAMADNRGSLSKGEVEALQQFVRRVQEHSPGEEGTLPVYLSLLAGDDAQDASLRLHALLDADTPPSERSLLRLALEMARVDPQGELVARCLDLSEAAHGVTPELVRTRAQVLHRAHRTQAALDLLAEAAKAAPDADRRDWDMVWASFLDEADHPDATAAWSQLVDAHPDDLRVQLAAVGSPSAWRDREAMARVIDRARGLSLEDGLTWRMARSRWLLESPDRTEEQLAECTRLLGEVLQAAPGSVQPRLLMAATMEELGNLDGAAEQLQMAAKLAPEHGSVQLELVRLAQARGDAEAARVHLDRFLRIRQVDPRDAEKAAWRLASLGEHHRAMEILDSESSSRPLRRAEEVLVARLSMRLGTPQRALDLAPRLLAHGDAATTAFVAEIYLVTGRRSESDAALRALDSLDVPAADRHLARSTFHENVGELVAAARHAEKAASEDPSSDAAWSRLFSLRAKLGDPQGFTDALSAARSAGNDGAALHYLTANEAALTAAVVEPRLRGLVADSIVSTAQRPGAIKALELVLGLLAEGGIDADGLTKLRFLADSYPQILPLQILVAEMHFQFGQYEAALRVARRAAESFPNASAPRRLMAALDAELGRWNEAMQDAREWRLLTRGGEPLADVLIAEASIHTGQPLAAAETLSRWLPIAREAPAEHSRLLTVHAWALVLTGRQTEASDLLTPLARESSAWRDRWLKLDVASAGAPAAIAWIEAVAALIPEEDLDGRRDLAMRWATLAEEAKDPQFLERAIEGMRLLREHPSADASMDTLLGQFLELAGRKGEAAEAYRTALARDPASVVAKNNLSMLLAEEGQWERAVELAKQVCAQAPDNPELLDTLANAYTRGGDHDRAASCYRSAADLEPGNARWSLNLAESLAEGGRREDARQVLDGLTIGGMPEGMPSELRLRLRELRASLEE